MQKNITLFIILMPLLTSFAHALQDQRGVTIQPFDTLIIFHYVGGVIFPISHMSRYESLDPLDQKLIDEAENEGMGVIYTGKVAAAVADEVEASGKLLSNIIEGVDDDKSNAQE
jgi:hypothetical protein